MVRDEELETKGSLQRRLDRHAYDRLIILSDGVFAIAITLAAFEIKVPETWRDPAELWTQLRLPVFTYFISFLFVATYWKAQRSLFARLVRVDAPLTALALLTLLFVALIPVVTGMFYDRAGQPGAREIYCATMAICGCLTAAGWGYAAMRPALVHPQSKARDCWIRFFRALFAPLILAWLAVAGSSTALAIGGVVVLTLARRFALKRFAPEANPL